LFKNNYVKTLNGRKMVRPRQDAKIVAYWGDGSGRDTYCITDAGGLKGLTKNGCAYSNHVGG